MTKKNVSDAKGTPGTDVPKSTIVSEENGKKTYKLNRELFEKLQKTRNAKTVTISPITKRSDLEEDGKSLLRRKQGEWNNPSESFAYFSIRDGFWEFIHAMTGTGYQFRSPQHNVNELMKFVNSHFKREFILQGTYDARNYSVKFYFADDPAKTFRRMDLTQPQTAKTIREFFGI